MYSWLIDHRIFSSSQGSSASRLIAAWWDKRGITLHLSHHELAGLLQVLRGDETIQRPGDAHGAIALMRDVAGAAQEGVGGGAKHAALLELAHEQQHAATALGVVDVALASGELAEVVD